MRWVLAELLLLLLLPPWRLSRRLLLLPCLLLLLLLRRRHAGGVLLDTHRHATSTVHMRAVSKGANRWSRWVRVLLLMLLVRRKRCGRSGLPVGGLHVCPVLHLHLLVWVMQRLLLLLLCLRWCVRGRCVGVLGLGVVRAVRVRCGRGMLAVVRVVVVVPSAGRLPSQRRCSAIERGASRGRLAALPAGVGVGVGARLMLRVGLRRRPLLQLLLVVVVVVGHVARLCPHRPSRRCPGAPIRHGVRPRRRARERADPASAQARGRLRPLTRQACSPSPSRARWRRRRRGGATECGAPRWWRRGVRAPRGGLAKLQLSLGQQYAHVGRDELQPGKDFRFQDGLGPREVRREGVADSVPVGADG